MKILFAYDGSECADAALEDLTRAGLDAEADVLVMTLADVFGVSCSEFKLSHHGSQIAYLL